MTETISEIQGNYAIIESGFQKIFSEPAQKKWNPKRLVDLKNFKDKLTESSYNFRWPTEDIIESLNLEEPLELKAVRTKGGGNNCTITAI